MFGRRGSWGVPLMLGALGLVTGCADDGDDARRAPDSGSASVAVTTGSTSPVSTTSPRPPAEPRGTAVVAFDVDLADVGLVTVTATAAATSPVEAGGYWMIERWNDATWARFAHVGDTASIDGTIPVCPVSDGAEDCAQSLESRPLEPGQQSFRHRIDIAALPTGLYRVRLDTDDEATSDHLEIDASGASIIQRDE